VSRLKEAEDLAEERQKTIDQMRDSYDLTARHCKGLASTLHQRNVEALRMTQRWDKNEQKNKTLVICLRDWKSTLGAMQEEVNRKIAEHISNNIA